MAKKKDDAKTSSRNQIVAQRRPDEEESVAVARTAIRPTVQASLTLQAYDKIFGDLELAALVDSLSEQAHATSKGDLRRAEGMLTAQARTLDAIFNNLARRAINAEYMDNLDRYLKLALRAQSQCRATWEAVATIKNPPMMGYVQQANIAHGPQQVNNGTSTLRCGSRADEIENPPNKLLEEQHGERLDTGTASTSGRADTSVEAVGTVKRSEDG